MIVFTAAEIAAYVGGTLHGDPETLITGVNGIREAQPGELTFVRSARYAEHLPQSKASAVLMAEDLPCSAAARILVSQPDLAFAQVLQQFESKQLKHPEGIHESAVIDPTAQVGAGVAADAFVRIAEEARIGERVILYAGVYVGRGCVIGDDSVLYPGVTIREESTLGARCIVHAGARIGSDGFGFAPLGGHWVKIPQIGRVSIGNDVEIGSNTCIDRATFGHTRIGDGVKIDNLVQIGHNVEIGKDCVIAGKSGIAGSAIIGNQVRIGASAGINGHIDIGDGASIGARAGVTKSVPAGATVSGFPAMDHRLERRVLVAQQKAPELLRRVRQLERQVQALEEELHG